MRDHLDDIDYEFAEAKEKELRHDVMSHIYAFGEVAPLAMPIIHLGATSQFINCNAELIMLRDSMRLVHVRRRPRCRRRRQPSRALLY